MPNEHRHVKEAVRRKQGATGSLRKTTKDVPRVWRGLKPGEDREVVTGFSSKEVAGGELGEQRSDAPATRSLVLAA